ncbi:hypothetical protein ACS0TY_021299 [Phlomoides rotata]
MEVKRGKYFDRIIASQRKKHVERDSDGDGELYFKEFFHGLFDLVRNYDEGSLNSSYESDEATARTLFNQLDKDGDGRYLQRRRFSHRHLK